MPNNDLGKAPLFKFIQRQGEFIQRQGERLTRFTRRFVKTAAPYGRRARRYWEHTSVAISFKSRMQRWKNRIPHWNWRNGRAVEPEIVSQERSAPSTLLPGTDFLQGLLQRSLSPKLHALLGLRCAARIACSVAMEQKSRECLLHGWPEELIAAIRDGAHHPDLTLSENLLLQYADDITRTPIDVDLQLFRKLRRHFTQDQIGEATASICYENFRIRHNNAVGMASPLSMPAGIQDKLYEEEPQPAIY